METNVSQLLKSPVGSIQNFNIDGLVDIVGEKKSLVKGKVRLMRTGRGILVEGDLQTEVEVGCSRCLNLYPCPLKFRIAEEYYPTVDLETGSPLSAPDDTVCFSIDANHVLDLTEAVRQYALLAIPMKPLCRKECAGLCPVCGKGLNYGACDCPVDEVDPRWAGLEELVSKGRLASEDIERN